MQEEKAIFPERAMAPAVPIQEVICILPASEEGIPLINNIADTAKLCKQYNVGLSEWQIRRLCDSGAIPFIPIGSKRLINWNVLMSYVNSGGERRNMSEPKPEVGIVSRIPEKLRA